MSEPAQPLARDNWLRRARKRLGLTQAAAGALVGLSENRWSEIEAGMSCALSTALAIEALTGIAPKDWRRTDEGPPLDAAPALAAAR